MKNSIIDQVLAREGGYSDNPADSGSKTRYGITEAVAKKWGYTGDMSRLPRSIAVAIYADLYWPSSYDQILDLSPTIVAEIFDTGVNLGVSQAGKFLQRCLNVLNREETDYPDVVVDGVVGTATVKSLAAYLQIRRGRGETALLTALNGLQCAFYVGLCEKRKKDEAFLFGWLNHRITL